MSVNYRKLYKNHYGIDFGPEYVIHHIDMNRENNSISNLLLMPRSLHSKYHAALTEFRNLTGNFSGDRTKANIDFSICDSMCLDMFQFYLSNIMDNLKECQIWADYKHYLDGTMPNIHGIKIGR